MAISVGEAVGEGFRLIGRRPWAVLGWGMFLFVGFIIAVVLLIAIVGVSSVAALSRFGARGAAPTADDFKGMAALMVPLFVIVGLVFLLITAVIHAAVLRAVLEPDSRGFASIRLGGQEVWLIVLYLVYGLFGLILTTVVVGLTSAAYFAGHLAGNVLGWVLAVLVGFFVVPAAYWVGMRFALAAPMTFVERRLVFFESWTATQGAGWTVYGLAWLLFLIAMGLGFAYSIISTIIQLMVVGVGIAGAAGSLSNSGSTPNPASVAAIGPMLVISYLISFLLYALFLGVMQAVMQAPWAAVYRQLRGPPDVAATFS